MSLHAKRNFRPRLRVLGTVTGVALLLGGGFAAQAVADVKPAPAAPTVTTDGDATPQVASAPGVSAPAVSKPGVSAPGVSAPAGAAKVVAADKSADKSAAVAKPAAAPAPAENAPRVINPGSGVQK
ncbi:hypothetical protein [Kitasatospora sp. MAP5-34]|uniref:hypothetical protein n=1 Tax=Kitasatospora sp. MAP5-34 TaxID=3035102 RepID=UPI0024739C9E|nr:hypothetical protein [Kitasatospora sp. MAP5-34]MDH6575012.1 hypothetical protein [Kitasatospora sp. MAP5-34]